VTTCRSCGAPVTWALTERKKWMPVDREPAAGGNVQLEPGSPPFARVLSDVGREQADGPLHLSHFVTCPNAGQHRKAAA
jgi:hypothetical protein